MDLSYYAVVLLIMLSIITIIANVIEKTKSYHKYLLHEEVYYIIRWLTTFVLIFPFPIWVIYELFIYFNIKITIGG